MTEPKRRGCLGCSPVVIIIGIVLLALVLMAFMAGPIGSELFGTQTWLSWMSVPEPAFHLPAAEIFSIGNWPVANTTLAAFVTVIFLIVVSWAITRRMRLVPRRLQGVFESILGWMYDFCTSVAGEKNSRRFFPVVTTIFLFVLFNGWLSLIPGFGSVEIKRLAPVPEGMHVVASADHPGEYELVPDGGAPAGDEGHAAAGEVVLRDGQYYVREEHELLRGANTDVNTPLAIALVSFVFVAFVGFRALGAGWLKQYFNFGPLFRSIGRVFTGKLNFMDIFNGAIGVFVGILEFFSLLIRNVSFTFRLFGNMTAGEILLLIAAYLLPWFAAIPFFGLELIVGVIQGLVFAGLTLVFATLSVTSHEGESHS